jgi:hypothetical protein
MDRRGTDRRRRQGLDSLHLARHPRRSVPQHAPTGKNVTVAAWTIDRFADGKVAESRIIMDTLGLMQQLGVIPAPGAPPS